MRYTIFYRKQFALAGRAVPETVQLDNYQMIGDAEADDLEHLFRVMNVVDGSDFEMPQKLRCRSMCSGDVAIDNETGIAHYCASIGWDRTKFE